MADYHDLYLNGGVLLLHFIIETFREESINSFNQTLIIIYPLLAIVVFQGYGLLMLI